MYDTPNNVVIKRLQYEERNHLVPDSSYMQYIHQQENQPS